MQTKPVDHALKDGRTLIYRTPLAVRVTHWIIAWSLLVLLLSGLQIFNARAALSWGDVTQFEHPFLEIGAQEAGNGAARGFLRIGSFRADTTGILGVSKDSDGKPRARAFPRWMTLPSYQDLASGRRWHFFYAWLLVISICTYAIANFVRGRLWRDLWPTSLQWRGLSSSILDHLRLRMAHGAEARHYNVLQKIAYLGVMFVLIPFTIATGLALSPALDTACPWLPWILGGRQSARSLHFICTWMLVLFFFVHILMLVLAGPLNEMRSIITGWFAIRTNEK